MLEYDFGVSLKEIVLWLIVPLTAILLPFLVRFLLISGFWYFHINLSFAFIITLYIGLYYSQTHATERLLFLITIFEIPILYLAVLGAVDNPIRELIAEEGGLQALIGVFQGFLGVYVYGLGAKLKIKPSEEIMHTFRHIASIISFLSIIVSLAIFGIQAPYTIAWVIRPVLLISGFIIGVLALTMGFIYGKKKNVVVQYLGAIMVFCISFVLGTIITPLVRIGKYIFPAMSAFASNSILLTGLIGYLLSDERCPLTQMLQKIRNFK